MRRTFLAAVLAAGLALPPASAATDPPRFCADDPVWDDPDRLPIPPPARLERSQIADFLVATFLRRPEGPIPPAENTNTLGHVPDSSWYTNRMSVRRLSLDELVRGPDRLDGPARPFRVLAAKSEGRTPGFTIRDARDDVYLVKLDPKDEPQLATSAEVVSTKFFYAFGYHVPENYLVFLRPEDLELAPEATLEELGVERRLEPRDLDRLLEQAGRLADGRIPALASRFLDGRPVGPFLYYDTRPDDPNDLFPHENRRELRGLRVFASWLNHDDARSINTLDMYVAAEDGRGGYLRHHLIDFGSTLGSGSVGPQNPRAGHEYILEWGPIAKAGLTLGIWERPWRRIRYPSLPAVGNFESAFFDPAGWKPEYPNPAFERMRPADAFWAARIVQRFDDEAVRALVRTGRYEDPEAEAYLVATLLERRDKIVRYYLSLLSPVDEFRLVADGRRIAWSNPGLAAGLARSARYRYRWFRYNNESEPEPLGLEGTTEEAALPIPAADAPYAMLRLETEADGMPAWEKPVDVYIALAAPPRIVGLVRTE